ncbi:MAG: response regulator, partial [Gammaproteobacteria bacterium]
RYTLLTFPRIEGTIVLQPAEPSRSQHASSLSGQELLKRVADGYPDVPVIVITAINDLETAVHCMQAGAIDYLVKPVESSRLVSSVRRALELRSLRDLVARP